MITTPLMLVRFSPRFDSWLATAQNLLQQGAAPSSVEWLEETDPARLALLPERPPMRVNDSFLALARSAACHRSPERWTILYRLLWRLVHGQSRLLSELLEPDVTRLHTLARDVERDVRRLVKTIHFTSIDTTRGTVELAWAIPQHHSVELAAPQIARQQQDTLWSLLTPDLCAHWNGRQLLFSPGEHAAGAGSPRALETLWRNHHAARFELPVTDAVTKTTSPAAAVAATVPVAAALSKTVKNIVNASPASAKARETHLTIHPESWSDLPLFARKVK
jgi:uracil-DNA glycosylase